MLSEEQLVKSLDINDLEQSLLDSANDRENCGWLCTDTQWTVV